MPAGLGEPVSVENGVEKGLFCASVCSIQELIQSSTVGRQWIFTLENTSMGSRDEATSEMHQSSLDLRSSAQRIWLNTRLRLRATGTADAHAAVHVTIRLIIDECRRATACSDDIARCGSSCARAGIEKTRERAECTTGTFARCVFAELAEGGGDSPPPSCRSKERRARSVLYIYKLQHVPLVMPLLRMGECVTRAQRAARRVRRRRPPPAVAAAAAAAAAARRAAGRRRQPARAMSSSSACGGADACSRLSTCCEHAC